VRNRFLFLLPALDYLGALMWTTGFVLLVPLVVRVVHLHDRVAEVAWQCYAVPAALSLLVGFALKRRARFLPLDSRGAMLLCTVGWLVVSAFGAVPLWMGIREMSVLDAFFEAVSGFTTTGITMLTDLDAVPRSLIFWRALMQWVGGLGILAFFLAVATGRGSAHHLFSAESHKIFSRRPAPGLFNTLKILWAIYSGYTLLVIGALMLEGLPVFDAVAHGLTTIATGGFSPYDASIGHYARHATEFPNYRLIEWTLIAGMLLGGLNFFIHYRVLSGDVKALWDNSETRLYWLFITGAVGLVLIDQYAKDVGGGVGDRLRDTVFHVVALITSSGFVTRDLGGGYFPAVAKLVFLVLMVLGACVGSTSGGLKLLRIGILLRMVGRQVRRVIRGRDAVEIVTVDGERIEMEELRRIAALFFAWIVLLFIGGAITALLSDHGPLESASGMFSALGNIGPCYIDVEAMPKLDPMIKVTYILGMLAGRLEILPVLLIFHRRTWR
jgi:trk system potassium uptake protein TrkH